MHRQISKRKLFLRFICIGLLATIIDGVVYQWLAAYWHEQVWYASVSKALSFDDWHIIASKAVAFEVSVLLNFVVSAMWNFKIKWEDLPSRLFDFLKLYAFSGVVNVTSNFALFRLLLLTNWVPDSKISMVAWLFATALTAALNYTGQTFWVFKPKTTPPIV
jgi:putative flippase GtrA